jgi:hypothetical protein
MTDGRRKKEIKKWKFIFRIFRTYSFFEDL